MQTLGNVNQSPNKFTQPTCGDNFTKNADMEIVNGIKEKLCSVAQDPSVLCNSTAALPYELPDGRTIDIGVERFHCPEALFEPCNMGMKDCEGVHKIIHVPSFVMLICEGIGTRISFCQVAIQCSMV